jgi:thioredoxin 1
MRIAIFLSSLLLSTAVLAATALPYNEKADAKAEIDHALVQAKAAHVPVLLIFGANWCEDCRALSAALKNPKNAALIDKEFRVVKIDVGNFDHNVDLAQAYGNPIKKGIPAAVVVTPDNKVLYATKGGELADARRMSDTGVYDFFEHVAHPK